MNWRAAIAAQEDAPRPGWMVRDCPEHECCALEFPEGVLCLACGQRIVDTLAGLVRVPPSPELVASAKAAWLDNQGVRDFTASALLQAGDDDGTQQA